MSTDTDHSILITSTTRDPRGAILEGFAVTDYPNESRRIRARTNSVIEGTKAWADGCLARSAGLSCGNLQMMHSPRNDATMADTAGVGLSYDIRTFTSTKYPGKTFTGSWFTWLVPWHEDLALKRLGIQRGADGYAERIPGAIPQLTASSIGAGANPATIAPDPDFPGYMAYDITIANNVLCDIPADPNTQLYAIAQMAAAGELPGGQAMIDAGEAIIQQLAQPTNTDTLGAAVYDILAQQYPAALLTWVADATWTYDPALPLASIDMARRPGGRDEATVDAIEATIRAGKEPRPIVAVQTPDKLQIADGWHRTLAAQHANRQTLPAYVGSVTTTEGPWQQAMHNAKLTPGTTPPPTLPASTEGTNTMTTPNTGAAPKPADAPSVDPNDADVRATIAQLQKDLADLKAAQAKDDSGEQMPPEHAAALQSAHDTLDPVAATYNPATIQQAGAMTPAFYRANHAKRAQHQIHHAQGKTPSVPCAAMGCTGPMSGPAMAVQQSLAPTTPEITSAFNSAIAPYIQQSQALANQLTTMKATIDAMAAYKPNTERPKPTAAFGNVPANVGQQYDAKPMNPTAGQAGVFASVQREYTTRSKPTRA